MRARQKNMIPKCWFDADNCTRGIEALRQYRRDFDEKLKTWRGRPLHDWTSHGADAFRYLAVGYRRESDWGEPIRRNLRGIAQCDMLPLTLEVMNGKANTFTESQSKGYVKAAWR